VTVDHEHVAAHPDVRVGVALRVEREDPAWAYDEVVDVRSASAHPDAVDGRPSPVTLMDPEQLGSNAILAFGSHQPRSLVPWASMTLRACADSRSGRGLYRCTFTKCRARLVHAQVGPRTFGRNWRRWRLARWRRGLSADPCVRRSPHDRAVVGRHEMIDTCGEIPIAEAESASATDIQTVVAVAAPARSRSGKRCTRLRPVHQRHPHASFELRR
jgi:hypothetical protein